jgi:hypothetical protein
MWVKVAAADRPWQQRQLEHIVDDSGGASKLGQWQLLLKMAGDKIR